MVPEACGSAAFTFTQAGLSLGYKLCYKFNDEAYRLYDPLGRSYMQEAVDEIVTLLTDTWGLPRPPVIISVTGAADTIDPSAPQVYHWYQLLAVALLYSVFAVPFQIFTAQANQLTAPKSAKEGRQYQRPVAMLNQ